jgi:LDH2 family malate/lactate/ureidoglycolate dehydrogenase
MASQIEQAAARPPVHVPAAKLQPFVAALFRASGLSEAAAATMAEALVEADLSGLPSHGVMQGEVYLARLKAGSLIPAEKAEIAVDRDSVVVLDAHYMLGHLAANHGVAVAVERAKRFGAGIVAVRNGFHFGAAGRYALAAAKDGCIGIAMANTRPVMPAPGGAQPLVGTNPIAIAIPTANEPAIVLDMATSEGSVGKIRMAGKAGKPIPATWAVKADGSPTTDPAEALTGMLLPAAGPKGFGLSLVVDLLCGLLSQGAWGDAIATIHGDLTKPAGCAHLFMAFDVAHFRALDGFLAEAQHGADRVRKSRRAPGVERIYVPGERKWQTRRNSDGRVKLEAVQVDGLRRLAGEFGVSASALDG